MMRRKNTKPLTLMNDVALLEFAINYSYSCECCTTQEEKTLMVGALLGAVKWARSVDPDWAEQEAARKREEERKAEMEARQKVQQQDMPEIVETIHI